jgi:hypothetical protein
MKKQIAVNTKFFTRTQAKGEMAHVKREFENDKNVIDEKLTKNNFGNKDGYINKNYTEALLVMSDKTKNTLIDSVLVLPVDQLEQVKKDHPKDWKKKIHESIMSMMSEMESEMGFKPLGYKMHLDEGKERNDGTIKLNPHAHLLFANVCVKDVEITKTKKITQKDENGKAMRDPEKPSKWLFERDKEGNAKTEEVKVQLNGKAPLSHYQQRGDGSVWSKQQDIAAKHLEHLGFERGTPKSVTKASHKDKAQWVESKLKAKELEVAELTAKLKSLKDHEKVIQDRVPEFLKLTREQHNHLRNNEEEAFKATLKPFVELLGDMPKEIQEECLEELKNEEIGFSDSWQLAMLMDRNDKLKKARLEQPSQKPATSSKPRMGR